jgi:RCC1 and BTB domain-containing protein
VVLANDGSVLTWGRSEYYQIYGDGSATSVARSTPRIVSNVIFGKTIIDIAAGASTTYAVSESGTLYSWGKGDQ